VVKPLGVIAFGPVGLVRTQNCQFFQNGKPTSMARKAGAVKTVRVGGFMAKKGRKAQRRRMQRRRAVGFSVHTRTSSGSDGDLSLSLSRVRPLRSKQWRSPRQKAVTWLPCTSFSGPMPATQLFARSSNVIGNDNGRSDHCQFECQRRVAFDNSEDKARVKAGSDPGFECMLQRHAVPVKPASTWPGGAAMGPIEYYLSFLEFQENRPRRSQRAGRFGVATLAT
jgi:hypothetical protein